MKAFALHLLTVSIPAGVTVLAVLLLRLLLKKAPKRLTCLLWILVALRLVLPASVTSMLTSRFSIVPAVRTAPVIVPNSPTTSAYIGDEVYTVFPLTGLTVSVYSPDEVTVPEADPDPLGTAARLVFLIWCAGAIGMVVYAAVSRVKIGKSVAASVPCETDGITRVRLCDGIRSPFILGVFRPTVYLPSEIGKEEKEFVLAHEKAHLSRLDHLTKPLAFLLLTVYWFHPLVWVAFLLFCRDAELACDESVIRGYGREEAAQYSETLLSFASARRPAALCPLAFGEVGVKARVKAVLNYKKPALWILVAAVLLIAVSAVLLLTDPKANRVSDIPKETVTPSGTSDFNTEIRFGSSGYVRTVESGGYHFAAEYSENHLFTCSVVYRMKTAEEQRSRENALWETRFPDFNVCGVYPTPYGAVVIGNTPISSSFETHHLWIAGIDENGKVLWKERRDSGLPMKESPYFEHLSDVAVGADGSVTVFSFGRGAEKKYPDNDYMITRYSAAGKAEYMVLAPGAFGQVFPFGDAIAWIEQTGNGEQCVIRSISPDGTVRPLGSYAFSREGYYATKAFAAEYSGKVAFTVQYQTSPWYRDLIKNYGWLDDVTDMIRENTLSVLYLADPETGTLSEIHKAPGSMNGITRTDGKNLIWAAAEPFDIRFSPATDSFSFFGSCTVVNYVFDQNGNLLKTEKTGETVGFRE
ncbi:MAG: M56 family metallopeptidase [Lachnospiraceae bacterium]|nr:M56 family metallopeptidase [Lachnospiraceae bacterium]